MNKFKNKIADFLTSNNAWIYSVVLTVFSFMWVMTFVPHNGIMSMVYLHPDKWILFFKLLGFLHLLFIPYFIFSICRNIFDKKFNPKTYRALWVLFYIVYPFFTFGIFSISDGKVPVVMVNEIIWFLTVVVIIVELFTNPLLSLPFKLNAASLKKHFKPEWILILIALYLSCSMTFHLRMEHSDKNVFLLFIYASIPLIWIYLFYYINHYVLINMVYRKKGILYYGFSFIALLIILYLPYVSSYFYIPVFQSAFKYTIGTEWIGENPPLAFWAAYSGMARTTFLFTIPIIIIIQWLKQDQQINKLSKEKSETELTMLKQQINPHFFFNTLNNVYSMSLTKDEQTPEAILQLSDLMRYVIYKGQEETVTLSDEIKYIEDYLELQKMRLHQKFDLKFDKNIENSELLITPLLFIILIENAFKHGIEGAENDSYLHLSLIQQGQQLTFTCVNSLEESDVPHDTGLGLTNLRRRLELVYPERYSLTTTKNASTYTAELQISF